MTFQNFLNKLPALQHITLPAQASHFKMLPPTRQVDYSEVQKQNARQAAVTALCYPDAQQNTTVIFILRKVYNGAHSGQIAFPGGKYEPEDGNLKTTALRETNEEIGIPISDINIIKQLTPVYIPPSNFNVQPYLAYTTKTPTFKKQDTEVEALLEIPLADILATPSLITAKVQTSKGLTQQTPAFKLGGYTVWGATAMMLSEVKDIIKQLT